MTRNDALLRLSARLIVRRNALLKALHDEIETFGNDSQSSAVGDSVDAAIDSANEEICSQLVAHESRELGQIEHALDRIAGSLRALRVLWRQDSRGSFECAALHQSLYRLSAEHRKGGTFAGARRRDDAVGDGR